MTWKEYPIYKREDDSFVIVVNEAPYHVPNEGEWAELYAEVAEYYATNENCRSDHEMTFEELQPKIELTEEELSAMALAQAKSERAAAVAAITVEVDGMVFDGDEASQTRMGRTISGALALGIDINTTTRKWVLHDDTVAYPTVAQLARALYLAGEAQTDVWTVPYES
jgi:hypothetical protein